MIRPIRMEDRVVVMQLMREFYHSPAVLHPVPQEHLDKTLSMLLRGSPYADGFVLALDAFPGNTVGYLLTARTWSNEAGGEVVWVEELYVRPEYRGYGLGHEAFTFLDRYYGMNVRCFRLEIEPENLRAARLYEQVGYTFLDYRPMVRERPENDASPTAE